MWVDSAVVSWRPVGPSKRGTEQKTMSMSVAMDYFENLESRCNPHNYEFIEAKHDTSTKLLLSRISKLTVSKMRSFLSKKKNL